MSILDKLTEGIVSRDLRKEGEALLGKWERTGLLEGLSADNEKEGMARLLENQAKQLLKEASSMEAGNVEGFASVAFPLVRRVFGGLLANDVVSVQPMSLPSGLIFFLDFTFGGSTSGGGVEKGDSIYGGGKVAAEITGGISLTGESGEDSFYNLNQGFASPSGSVSATLQPVVSGTFGGSGVTMVGGFSQDEFDKLCRFDADFIKGTTNVAFYKIGGLVNVAGSGSTFLDQLNTDSLIAISGAFIDSGSQAQVRRLTQWSGSLSSRAPWKGGDAKNDILVAFASVDGTVTHDKLGTADGITGPTVTVTWPQTDDFATGQGNPGSVIGTTSWALENEAEIPEIDIKVSSIAVTAVTKKLKAKWTPELGQDLNAYHNLDAEVELTSILSEQIALEIDKEILNDLVVGAAAGRFYWSRSPGLFVNRETGAEIGATSAAPDFTGTVSEWYETLIETINDVSAQIHRKTLRGGANFIVVGPEVANILEFTAGFRASVTADAERGTVGAVKTGAISKKWDVYVDPYFPRNVVLVGRKGGSFLESGYVYAPYVPLQVTPTIFGVEDFVPRKGVMTRYAKKMVRPDMYGLVIVRGLLGESGA
jgi:hypothetical protein